MPPTLPDPRQVAQHQADYIRASRDLALEVPLQRVLADAPFVDRASLLAGLEAFHRERMAKIPSPAKFPEAGAWVAHVLAVDQHLRELIALTDAQIALFRSLSAYLLFRGFAHARPAAASTEKCRVAYLPDSDVGRIHIKNLDDPSAHWRPEGVPTWHFPKPGQTLWGDGVGNGLHMDDEPAEIFPLPINDMLGHYASDVPGAVEFLTRYSPFWGSCNRLFHDSQRRSCAIEKCSHNFIEVFYPNSGGESDGRSYISGMCTRDPQSPQGRYQRRQRQKYVTMFNQPADGVDNTFWGVCDQFERKLAAGVKAWPKKATFEEVRQLFTTLWPEGLNKPGLVIHAQQHLDDWTLMTYATLLDQRKVVRWQRTPKPEMRYPQEAEVFEF